jgi:NADH-quinone oxidoreductase subunit B
MNNDKIHNYMHQNSSKAGGGPEAVADFPGDVHPTADGGVMISKLQELINWSRSNSLWPLTFATSCCGIEMMSTAGARYDFSRFGFEVARATPRQADVIIIAGTIVNKMAPVLKRLYDQMAEPKYVVAMGACAISGGPFFYNTYSVVKGADHVIPVDVYIPGCPPRPEALLHALISLQDKIKAGLTREQIREAKV